MKTCIDLFGLTLKHGPKVAIENLTLSLPQGCVTAVLGRNGAGKSTLLDGLLGLIKASAGSIQVLGRDPWSEGARLRRDIGYVEADPWFDPTEKVESVIGFFAALHPNWDPREVERLSRSLDLRVEGKVKALSRGMRTKLALILALAHRPRLLVLDEPFDGLDCAVRDEILAEIINQVDEERSIIITSHDLDEVERIAEQVVIIREGRLVLNATLDDLRLKTQRMIGRLKTHSDLASLGNLMASERVGDEVCLTFFDENPPDQKALAILGDFQPLPPASLKESFLALTGPQDRDGVA